MNPEKLFFLDKKVVQNDRRVSLTFSLAIAVLLILIEKDVINTYSFSYPVFWTSVSLFIVIGFLKLFWNPYTKNKVLTYNVIYALSGALISIFITGFLTPLVALSWLILIITSTIYFKRSVWFLIYGIFVVSAVIWIIDNLSELTIGDQVTILTSVAFVGLISSFVYSVWDLFHRSIKKLDASRESEKLVSDRLSSLINSMVDGVIATDDKGQIAIYNGAALNLLDLNIDLHGKTLESAGEFVDSNNQNVQIHKFIMDTKSQKVSRDFRLKYSDGSLINLYISVSPVHLGFGQRGAEGYVILFRDITREKSLEEERDEFISVVSHELRTPVAIAEGEVGNASFLAAKTINDKKITDALKQAHDQILFLSSMINDLGTLSRAERGKLAVEIEKINVNELVNELEADYLPQAKNKNLKLVVKSDPNLTLKSSKLYVREILQNFLTNAIKYTEKGDVVLGAKAYEKGVIFEVIDSGIGISKADQEKVFDKFFRSEDYRTRANSGTGLGLYVTLKLANLIHAELDLVSQLNKGSTFTIKIPNLK